MDRAWTRRDRRQDRWQIGIGPLLAAIIGAAALPAFPALAQQPAASEALDAARAAFEALPEADRKAIQDALVWTGDYNGTLDGAFGKRSFDAIRAFETRSRLTADGILTPAERDALLAAAQRQRDAAGFAVIDDRRTGIRIGVPQKVLADRSETPDGSLFRARRGGGALTTDFIPATAGTDLKDLYADLSAATPGRRITYKVLRDSWFVVTGEEGADRFFTRFAATAAGLRGFTVAYPASAAATFDRLTIAITNSFEPEPEAASATTATAGADGAVSPGPTVSGGNAFTAIVLDGGRALTSAAAGACKAPMVGGKPVKIEASGGAAFVEGAFAAAGTPVAWRRPEGTEQDVFVLGHAAIGGERRLVATPGVLKMAGDGTARLAAPVQPGMAGAPVIDRSGALVAIVGPLPQTMTLVAGIALGTSVPATTAESLAKSAGLAEASGTGEAVTLGAAAEAWRSRIVAVECPGG